MKGNASNYNLITILGPTASGKTAVAAHLAKEIHGEIISADSRQVYRSMNLGTGKDYEDYLIDGCVIQYHLIDILEPGYKYNVFEFQQDFSEAYNDILSRDKIAILCGGSGMYIEAILRNYKLLRVPLNQELRQKLELSSMAELSELLMTFKTLHNHTDTITRKRLVRAIEIAFYQKEHNDQVDCLPPIKPLVIGVKYDRDFRRKRISERLEARLNSGMIEEVEGIMKTGVKPEDLIYYGLEYKFITKFLIGEISREEMHKGLEIAIHQFAKRQMTWFRKMERDGFNINWLDANEPTEKKIKSIQELVLNNA